MRRQTKTPGLALAATTVLIIAMVWMQCTTPKQEKEAASETSATAAYVGSSGCQSCHAKEFQDWQKSDHFRAMQDARDSTVLGDFNNTAFTADGVTSHFFKKNGKFFMNTEGEDGKNHDYEIAYTFGYFPLQQYLVAFPGGRLQSTRASWDSRKNKWFHQYAGQKIDHHDWLHWTGNSQNWNTMCASCHSTDLQKNYDFTLDAYNTKWNDINVGCESCHGAGSKHVQFVQTSEHKNGVSLKNSGLLYAKSTSPQLQLNTCAPCHARKADLSQSKIHSGEIMDDMIPQIIDHEFFFADGQINQEDYEYSSFAQSKMFHNNVRCSNCHNPHSGKTLKIGNDLCMSCHKPKYNTAEHHFHTVNTEGAQCINCHMPEKTFMGVDHRRDHSFRIPRPDQSISYKTPNTCTGCHTGKSPLWAADAIKKWFGPTRPHHFSDDLLPGSQLNEKSEQHLAKLLSDTTQPEIARATAAFYLANLQSQSSANTLVGALDDKKPLVRYHAIRSLENFPADVWMQAAQSGLTDRVRAVRIAAAGLFHRLPPESLPPAARSAYVSADAENKRYLMSQTDFSVGNVMLADYELQGNDKLNAIQHYMRGLRKDSLMNYARLNLASAYSAAGKNQEALKSLKEAAAIDPSNDRIFYDLGLLYYEMGNIPSAEKSFREGMRLGSQNPGLFYNYGLLLQQQGNIKESEKILLEGFRLNPRAANINYALAYLYMQQKLRAKALIHAKILQQTDPGNPDYQGLFSDLGL